MKEKYYEIDGIWQYKAKDSPQKAVAVATDYVKNKNLRTILIDREEDGEAIKWALQRDDIEKDKLYTAPGGFDTIWYPKYESVEGLAYDKIIAVREKIQQYRVS